MVHSCLLSDCFAHCSVGAAISVESQDVPDVLSKLLFNPLCFLRYEEPTKPPDSWEDVRVIDKQLSLKLNSILSG